MATRYLVVGASVTRLAARAVRSELGVDNVEVEAVDGRSWTRPDMKGGPTLWQAFANNFKQLHAGDWAVIEMGAGWETVDTNRDYLREVIRVLPDDVCLAVIQPHTYYEAETVEMQAWNRAMNLMQREEIAAQPCHVQVWWSSKVRQWTANTPNLTAEAAALGAPLLYDGRHPTPAGQLEYARLIKYCTEH